MDNNINKNPQNNEDDFIIGKGFPTLEEEEETPVKRKKRGKHIIRNTIWIIAILLISVGIGFGVVVVGSVILSKVFFGGFMQAIAIIAGLAVGIIIGIVTEIYTSGDYKSVKYIAEQSETGAATTILSGFSVGLMAQKGCHFLGICPGDHIFRPSAQQIENFTSRANELPK